jgi:hypothetical protein
MYLINTLKTNPELDSGQKSKILIFDMIIEVKHYGEKILDK